MQEQLQPSSTINPSLCLNLIPQNSGPESSAGVTSYVNNIAYRAFGMKQMAYANGRTLSLGYDNRMRLASWDIPGVMGWSYAYNTPSIHENTQRVTFANNLYDHTLDRSYDYDAVGRMWASHSGAEGRAHAGYEAWGTVDGPYAENYSFDQLGNMTWRNGWGVANAQYNYGPAFVNNKMTVNPVTGASVGYDASGNLTNDGSQSYSYDATGQQTYASGSGGGSAPAFSLPDPLVAGVEIKLEHLTELRAAVDQLRARAGLPAATWTTDPNPQQFVTVVHHDHILQLRARLEEALWALHQPTGGYAHSTINNGDPIYAIDFQELRNQIKAAWNALGLGISQSYDGDRLRGKKSEYGAITFYVRSSVLGGQVIAELGASGNWARGYVYLGGQMLAIQNGAVNWVHQDLVTKSQRVTNSSGAVISTIDLDPWGGETNRSANSVFQPHKYTSYERDGNGGDDAMMRRYQSSLSRFSQPDPYDGSYSLADPQSFNRYSYVQNDPVNFTDPSGLNEVIVTDIWAPSWTPWGDSIFWRFLFWSPGGGGGGGDDLGGGGGGGRTDQNTPQNPAQTSSNPNCLQNALKGSPGVARPFATNPKDPSISGNHGAHALSPAYEADAVTLPPLTGTVAKTNAQDSLLFYVDVRITNRNSPLYGNYAVYFDLKTVSVTNGDRLGVGDKFGTARPAGDPRNEIGLHISLVRGEYYKEFNRMRAQGAIGFPTKFFINPLGSNSPINCPP